MTVQLALAAGYGAVASALQPPGLVNLTVYRVSPLAYPGLLNMDTGDPGGDIGFGLWELLMPMQCRGGGNHGPNIGCPTGTGKYIHPGDPTNVYEKFVVETNPLMGAYHNCNPNINGPAAGVFNCDSMDFGQGHCKCQGKDEVHTTYELYHEDCMNGTVFKRLKANESACEAACTTADECAAFAVNPSGFIDGMCHLLKEPLIQWDDGAVKSKCRCGIKNSGSLDVPSEDCACYKFNHLAMGFQYQGAQSGLIPGMPCSVAKTRSTCDSSFDCKWVEFPGTGHGGTTPGSCYSYSCSNHSSMQTCKQDSYDCAWNETSKVCAEFSCTNFTSPEECRNNSQSDCSWDAVKGVCGGGWHSPSHTWRDTAQMIMGGHWYSTQGVAKCNASDLDQTRANLSSEIKEEDMTKAQLPCGWKVASVPAVKNANCVNDKIVAAVERRNASCFSALPPGQQNNRSSDGWITCLFEGLLGNRKAGQPALKGGNLDTLDNVAELRAEIIKLWSAAFLSDDETSGCPEIKSQNRPDPPETPSAPGVVSLTLFATGTSKAVGLTNRNSVDHRGIVLQALWQAARPTLCNTVKDTQPVCNLPTTLLTSSLASGNILTEAKISANSFYGQFADCKANNGTGVVDDGAFTCAADWECWCDTQGWGSPPPPPGKSPCIDDDANDFGDPCMCDIWGGCGGGKWGPAVADKSKTVGRRSLKKSLSLLEHSGVDIPALQAVAASAHEFSTTFGGQCTKQANIQTNIDANPTKPAPLCTWALQNPFNWRSADSDCVNAAIVNAVEARAKDCLAQSACVQEHKMGHRGQCWLGCVLTASAMQAGEVAMESSFNTTSKCAL